MKDTKRVFLQITLMVIKYDRLFIFQIL
jgi:hypothetical protein